MDNKLKSTKFVVLRWSRREQVIVFVHQEFSGNAYLKTRAAFRPGAGVHPICDEASPLLDDMSVYRAVYDLMPDGLVIQRKPIAPSASSD